MTVSVLQENLHSCVCDDIYVASSFVYVHYYIQIVCVFVFVGTREKE